MDHFIDQELDKRFKELSDELGVGTKNTSDSWRSRSVITLALESYITEHGIGKQMDDTFRLYVKAQARLFLFAGHDTTSSTICYCFHMLSKHPEALPKMREEFDMIFGTDLDALSTTLSANPELINQLPYTLAVIKETMRLFPPASSMREGLQTSRAAIQDDLGNSYAVDGFYLWVLHLRIQRIPKYRPRPDDFLPERWLVGPNDPLHPKKGAWRPFEFGPRNCIGQTLVLATAKTVLVMTVCEFEIQDAYDEWDRVHYPGTQGKRTVWGERAYQIEKGGAHPADGYPCRVRVRQRS